ncbi:MAG: ABC transporter substrate-binding protein [Acetobacteraceae bacterium]
MNRRTFLAGAALIGAPVLAAPRIARAATQKFAFSLNWFPVGDHCAYYVALGKGYFEKAGLDVSLENSKGSGDSLAKIATGRMDAGLGEVAAVMTVNARGADLKIVGMVFDRTPLNVFSRKDMPANTPKDLEGHTIGAPPGDGQRQVWPAFVKANKIDESAVTWVNIEPTAKTAALAEKRVDFIADYTTGLPLYEKAVGQGNVVMMPWSRFGLNMYSMSIAASERTMKERPEALRGFLAAAYQGWRDVMADPQGSIAIYKKLVPEIDLDFITKNMAMGVDLMRTSRFAEHGIGWIDPARMRETGAIVNTYMGLPKQVDPDAVFTDAYLTKVEMPISAT